MAANPSELTRSPEPTDGQRPVQTAAPRATPRAASAPRMTARRKFEARKVRRLVRHIDPWSVLKLSLIFFFCMWLMLLIASVIVWQVALSSGTVGKIESFVSNLGVPNWKLNGAFLFRQFGLVGIIVGLSLAVATTIASVVFNLISDIIGGVWITVIEEETTRPAPGSQAAG